MRPCGRGRGFTLIEAAVAIAIIAILAGAMAPLALKAVNQQREFKTREGLKAVFEACFGSRDRRLANMRADFGFAPVTSLSNLKVMMTTTGTVWSATPTYATNGANFLWGWNGPYWTGSVDGSGNPADAWGRPLQLVVTGSSPTVSYQVKSVGPDSVLGTSDDLAYPNVAPSALAYNATVNLAIKKVSSGNISGSLRVQFPYGVSTTGVNPTSFTLQGTPGIGTLASSNTTTPPLSISNTTYQTLVFNPPSGSHQITFTPSAAGFTAFTLSLDLIPGETRQMDVDL